MSGKIRKPILQPKMKLGEALSILANELASSLAYEYYASEQTANRVAQAMSLSGLGTFKVCKDTTQPSCYWVMHE